MIKATNYTHNQDSTSHGLPHNTLQQNFLKKYPLYNRNTISTEHHPSVHRVDSFSVVAAASASSAAATSTTNSTTTNINTSSNTHNILESDVDEVDFRNEESEADYCYGGYHPVQINEKFGVNKNYKIVRKLGWGHFSTVWLAYDSISSKHVALKIIRSNKNYTQAALDEIKILEKIKNSNPNHPGFKYLVNFLDWFYHKGPNGEHVVMVFELLGENLLGLLNKFNNGNTNQSIPLHKFGESFGGLPISIVKKISKQLFLALDYLHRECGLIHTDIKPENILIEIKDVEKFMNVLNEETNPIINEFKCANSTTPAILRRSSSIVDSPIKCSKPLPSPLISTHSFDYFSNPHSKKKNQSNSTTSGSSINYYENYTHSQTTNATSISPSLSLSNQFRHNECIVSTSEANSDDEDEYDDEDNDEEENDNKINNNNKGINLQFGDISDSFTYSASKNAFQTLPKLSIPSHSSLLSSSPSREEDLSSFINIKLADLGNACYYNHHFTNDIQTRQYRSPEILLGHKWGASTDCWSVGCLIFELITGDYLFDPKNGKVYNKDDDHIAQILELLNVSKEELWGFVNGCKYSNEFFQLKNESDHSLQLKKIKNLKIWKLENVLLEKYKMSVELANEIAEFLLPLLNLNPEKRVDLGGWSNHDWLKDVEKNQSNIGFVNRPVGCCGEDIKGWSKRHRSNE